MRVTKHGWKTQGGESVLLGDGIKASAYVQVTRVNEKKCISVLFIGGCKLETIQVGKLL